MIRTRRLLLVFAAGLIACDQPTTAPSVDVQSMITAADPAAAANMQTLQQTLPALFREAVTKVDGESGKEGVDALLSDWRAHQNNLQKRAATADRAFIQRELEAIHNEELRVVYATLGNEAVSRAISETKLSLAESEALLQSARLDGLKTNGANIVEQVRAKVRAADALANAGKPVDALDMATQASTILSGLEYYLVEARRIGGIEALYPKAVSAIRAGHDEAALALLKTTETANEAATAALHSGDRELAHQKLNDARERQIELVVKTLGPTAATTLVENITSRGSALRDSLAALEKSGSDISRYQRMLVEANDLSKRARIAIDKQDYATALDLGSHAAGMLNVLQHLTRK